MKISQLNSGHFYGFDLLNEANLLNGEEAYEGHALKSYIEHYLQHLNSPEAKMMFGNKVAKLLMNDERYHSVVRELPPGAPKWAIAAKRKRELVYFKPDTELDDSMQHLSHYVSALEHDSTGNNNDVKAFANREIAGFPKAENLQLLVKKSQDYFKRGTKKVERSEEGMKMIHDSGDGFRWFLLQTPEAYKREGKALQNCIGSYYTRDSSREQGYELIILRKANNESIVAARIKNKAHEITEMKGKNNKPPIEKYMLRVIDFINKMKLKLSSTAESDFRRAGYFWIDKKMYTRSEAIKAFIKKEVLANFPDGNSLIRVKTESGSELVKELFRDLYPELQLGYGKTPNIYELRNSDDIPLISGAVEKKKLEKLQRHTALRESLIESVIKGRSAREFVGELIRRKIITAVNDKMARDLFWNERIKINHETGSFDPVKPEKDITSDPKHITWEKHTDDDQVKMVKQSLQASGGYSGSFSGDEDKWTPMGIHKVYITKEKMIDNDHDDYERHAKHFVMALTKDNLLVPVEVNLAMDRTSTTDVGTGVGGADNQIRRAKLINSVVALANIEKAKLTKSFKYNSGIIRDDKKYKVFEPKVEKLSGKPPAIKINLSHIPLGDRFAAINRIVTGGKIRSREAGDHVDRIHDHDTEVQLKLDYALADQKYIRGQSVWHEVTQEDSDNWGGKDVDALYKKVFIGTPDAIYLVTVTYGTNKKHEVFMLADGSTVVEVDGTTERHDLQSWGDHEIIANQLNAFADANKLDYHKDALGDKEELRISGGRIATGSMIQKQQLESLKKKGMIGKEGTDEVPFKDGTNLTRMNQEEQAEWVRRGLDVRSLPGEGWKVVDKNGNHLGIIVVANHTINTLYGPDFDWDSESGSMVPGTELLDMTNKQSITVDLLNYALGGKNAFGWKVKASQQFIIQPRSEHHDILKKAAKGSTVKENSYFHKVDDLGLIHSEDTERGQTNKTISLTPSGEAALKKLNKGTKINALTLGQGTKSFKAGWIKPTVEKTSKKVAKKKVTRRR